VSPTARGGVTNRPLVAQQALFERILVAPSTADLWELQKTLLVLGGSRADEARSVARAFHACLRTLESKSASRTASRWGAVLGTAAVGSVSLPDLLRQENLALEELLASALPAALEIGSAVGSAQAWEVEGRLIYDEYAWILYEALWEVSQDALPDLPADERRGRIDQVIDPLLDPAIPDGDRVALLVEVFRAVLTARMLPLLGRV
jgi:hypothetical protein